MNDAMLVHHWKDEPTMGLTRDEFDEFLLWAKMEIGANDIFIETNEPLGVKKDGVTYNVSHKVIERNDIVKILGEIYQESSDLELRAGKELNFPYSIVYGLDEVARFRVCATSCISTYGADEGIEIVLRPSDGIPPTVEELELSKKLVQTTEYSEGIVLITGPTGSGKTTTLASMIRHVIETQRKHILCFEEPIEYFFKMIPNRLSRIIQSEIPLNLKSFIHAISNCLRRSPDIIVMGELRENASIDGGILAAQTGHLVYATGHTNNVANALDRLVDSFPADDRHSKLMKLVAAIKAIIHQRLIPKRGGGRIAVREELYITNSIRFEIFNELGKGSGTTTNKLSDCVDKYGTSLKCDIKAKFREGHLSVDVCIQELVNELDADDINYFEVTTEHLCQLELITTEERETWLAILGGYSERL